MLLAAWQAKWLTFGLSSRHRYFTTV